MQEFRNKTPHHFIKETHPRLKDSLEWKEVLSNKCNWTSEEHLTPCHAGNRPLCWRRWHMTVKGQAVSCNAEGSIQPGTAC